MLFRSQLRPELGDRHRPVKKDVQRPVVGIIKTFQETEGIAFEAPGSAVGWRLLRALSSPKGPSVGDDVKLVEQHSPIPGGLALVVHIRALPLIDGFAPRIRMGQTGLGDLPGVGAAGAEEIRIPSRPLASAAELDDRQVPGKRSEERRVGKECRL